MLYTVVTLPDNVGGFLCDHDSGSIEVAADDAWHDTSVDDVEIL